MDGRILARLALLVSAIWAANACTRASEEELLRGKACSVDDDCISGFVCNEGLGVCMRLDSESPGTFDGTSDAGMDATGSAGSSGTDISAGGAGAGSFGNTAGDAANGGASSGGGGSEAGASGSAGTGAGAPGDPDERDAGPSEDPDAGTSSESDAGGVSETDAGGTTNDACTPECTSGYRCVESSCVPASWSALAPPPAGFVARQKAAHAVAGSKILIWGGVDSSGVDLSTGAIYDASQNTWQLTSVTANTPSGRVLASAAWTGSQFLVWGGRLNSGASEYNTGALYDPVTQIWTSSAAGAPARSAAVMLSYSAQVLSWGGWTRTGAALDKAQRYAVAGNTWTNTVNDLLGKREHVAWAGDGSTLYVAGGRSATGTLLSTGAVYEMGTNSWSALPSLPAARFGAFAAHNGSRLWLWGGRDAQQATGGGLLLGTTDWAPTAVLDEPSARWAPHRQSGWTCTLQDGRFALVGGHDIADVPQLDGGLYDPGNDRWDPIPAASEAHEWGVGVCVNGEIVLWGGASGGVLTTAGERWAP